MSIKYLHFVPIGSWWGGLTGGIEIPSAGNAWVKMLEETANGLKSRFAIGSCTLSTLEPIELEKIYLIFNYFIIDIYYCLLWIF